MYVRAFSPNAPGAKVLVSRGGGSDPRWRIDGKELFYVAAETIAGISGLSPA